MIVRIFDDADFERFFRDGEPSLGGWDGLVEVVERRVDYLSAAHRLEDIRCLPLGSLEEHSEGRYCINFDGWRARFTWRELS